MADKIYLQVTVDKESVSYLADEAGVTYEEAEKYVEENLVPALEESVQREFEYAQDELEN